MNDNLKKINLKIHGMHCESCEVLIERKFKHIPGVERVNVQHTNGKAELICSRVPDIGELDREVKPHGYRVSYWNQQNNETREDKQPISGKRHYAEIGAIVLIVVALYLILKQFDLVPNLGITENMSYGFVLIMGLVAAFSTCMAVSGGLLLAVATKYNEQHPGLTSAAKFKPHLYFNAGRIVSYTAFGGVVGAIGSALTFSPKLTGIVTIVASIVMILLGIQLLKLFPWLKRFQPKMPKFLTHKIHDLIRSDSKLAPLLFGASTFFLPCGFTQALQLYVLSQGDFLTGALTMFAFSLGTLPALMSVSAISSFAKGAFQRYFFKFAGVLVILLGFFNINNGLALTGTAIGQSGDVQQNVQIDPNVQLAGGKQIVNMKVVGYEYEPYRFTILQGVPVEWRIDGSQAAGCAKVITAPKLGVTEYLPTQGVKTIKFTPEFTGSIPFSCTMGMTTRGAQFVVIENTTGTGAPGNEPTQTNPYQTCDPSITNCLSSQKIQMVISRDKGFYPNTFTVKKGIPVEWEIDTQVPMGGCMSTLVIPQYNVAHRLTLGKTSLTFTPTQSGVVPFTCSMGAKLGQFTVI